MFMKDMKEQVKKQYGNIAGKYAEKMKEDMANGGGCSPMDFCGSTGTKTANDNNIAKSLYKQDEITDMPESVTDISLGCGNPTAIANLKPGETVLDLGSGGGIDCFLAAKAVAPTGYVIGVDMTDNMLTLANKNKAEMGVTNVEFRKGEIEDLPVKDNSVDVIISNCVINLSPDKDAVFREAFRVLKPGGRLIVSDIVTEGELPAQLLENINAWVGCVTGAIDQNLYLEKIEQAGFIGVEVESRTSYGLENLDLLDEISCKILTKDIDLNAIPDDVRLYSSRIIAHKPD